MKRPHLPLLLLAALLGGPLRADEPADKDATRDLDDARRGGWKLAASVADQLKAGDLDQFPGLKTWLADFDQVAKGIDPNKSPKVWAVFDVDALTVRNPNFWPAYFEVAPADPGLVLLQAGLLMAGGEAVRATHLVAVGKQRPGVPTEVGRMFDGLLAAAAKAGAKSNRLVADGIKRHDAGDYADAVKTYTRALEIWPQNGFAHYELGLSLRHQELVQAGQKPPAAGSVVVNGGEQLSAAVTAAYAKARQHDPFQLNAYQGGDKEVIAGFLALAERGLPVWKKIARDPGKAVDDKELAALAGACQDARNDELAVAARQVLVARRKGYAPADHPFLTASLTRLAPGKPTEQLLKRLAGGRLAVRQLIAPEGGSPAEMGRLRLYVPIPEVEDRFGSDIEPLAAYIKALEKRLGEVLAKEQPPAAKGLLVAVGLKGKKATRVWCEAVDGEAPAELLRLLEAELAKVEGVDLKKGPAGFAMEVQLFGKKPDKFPEFPQSWVDAAKKGQTKALVPPDALFKTLWPD